MLLLVPVPGEKGKRGRGGEGTVRRRSCSDRWLRRHQMAWDGSGDGGLVVAVWRPGGRGGFVVDVIAGPMLIRLHVEQLGLADS